MPYLCTNCKREVEELEERIRCPYCGNRIFVKPRPKIITKVKT